MSTCADPVERRRVLVAAILGASLGFIGASIVNVALPTFQSALGADATQIQWIVSGYNLSIAALLLSAGAFSDRIGHALTFKLGLAILVIASVTCGSAVTPTTMIIGRIVQGLAAALLVPSSLGLVNTTYPAETRGTAVGLWSSFSAVGAGIGPFFGGLLIEYLSWRYLFWMNVPIVILAWFLLERANVSKPRTPPRNAFDHIGAISSVLTLGFLTYAAIATSKFGITDPIVLSTFVAACIAGGAFIQRQRTTANPLLPLNLFHSRDFAAANIVTFLSYCTIGGGFYVMMLTWIQVQAYSPLAAGAITLPFMILTALLAHPVASIVRRFGAKIPLSLGTACLGVGFVSWAFPAVGTSFWLGYLPGVIITAIGIAMLVGPVTTVVVGAVPLSQSGLASGVNSAIARSAVLLSVAIMGAIHYAIFEYLMLIGLSEMTLDASANAAMRSELIKMAAASIPRTLSTLEQIALRELIDLSFLRASSRVMLIAGALSLLAAIIAFGFVGNSRAQRLSDAS